MKLFTRTLTLLSALAAASMITGCPALLDDDDSTADDDDSTGDDAELDCGDGVDNDADGVTDCDDPDCAADAECAGPNYIWVAVRSRTATQADLDNNTPGPDVDAVELFNGLTSEFVVDTSITFVPGAAGAAGNVNDQPAKVAGIPDSNVGGGDCVLAEGDDGTFWSMGSGDENLGQEGWFIAQFAATDAIVEGDVITVYEVGAGGCDNVGAARDDEYEVYIGTDEVDDTDVNADSFDAAPWMSLGTTGQGGDVFEFTVPALD